MKGRALAAALVCALTVLAGASWANQTESEPNSSISQAEGPINFDETLTGGLPGRYGSDSDPRLADYWEFDALADVTYRFVGTPKSVSVFYPLDIDMELVTASGEVVAKADTPGDNQIETLEWTFIDGATHYLIVYEHTGSVNDIARYEIACSMIDDDPPTYDSLAGIRLADRADDGTSATIGWHEARDNVTAAGDIEYNVYCDPRLEDMFVGDPEATFTGVLEGIVTGLDAQKDYYFGVRAQDEAGNVEENLAAMVLRAPTAVAPWHWMLYE